MLMKLVSILPQFIYRRVINKIFDKQTNYFQEFEFKYENIENELFNGNNELFLKHIKACTVFGEYGSGYTTIYAVNFAKKYTISAETSKEWFNKVYKFLDKNTLLRLIWIDVGETGYWGWPNSYSKSENFKKYFNALWEKDQKPDFVLIDGRFRVATFLSTLKFAKPGTYILFDDYVNREKYKIVENFEKPIETNNTQAIFKVSDKYNIQKIDEYISKFEFVMD